MTLVFLWKWIIRALLYYWNSTFTNFITFKLWFFLEKYFHHNKFYKIKTFGGWKPFHSIIWFFCDKWAFLMFTCRSLKLFLAVLRSAEICFFCLYISFILKCSWSITATTRPKMKRRENKSGEIFLRNSLTYLSYASFFRFTFNFVYWHDTWSKLSFNINTIKIVFPFHFHG